MSMNELQKQINANIQAKFKLMDFSLAKKIKCTLKFQLHAYYVFKIALSIM